MKAIKDLIQNWYNGIMLNHYAKQIEIRRRKSKYRINKILNKHAKILGVKINCKK